jgi:enhancing lycopene biosynthesis protein 2
MTDNTNIAVILSGCGVFDGSEIHEAVSTLLAIDKFGAKYQCFAPNVMQTKVIDHSNGEATALKGDEELFQRNVLSESARISRGNCLDLSKYNPNDYDAIIFPGGFGAATNLCSFANDGAECEVNEDVEDAIISTHKEGKPIGALCIAPVLISKVLGRHNIEVTIGNDENVAAGIAQMGAIHIKTEATNIHVDEANRIVSCPCYMLAKSISEVAVGTEKLVDAILDMI